MKHIGRAVANDVWSTSVNRSSHEIYAKDRADQRERAKSWKPDTLAIMANRIANNEIVGETHLWGREAVRMIVQGYITERELKPHRNSFLKEYKAMYSEEAFNQKLAELKERHEFAKKHYDLL